MDDNISPSLILLTYKGKVLLMNKSNSVVDEEKHPWSFIVGIIKNRDSFENVMSRRVKKETGIEIEKVELVDESCYVARLTDDNVNKIERAQNQLLNFFTLKELKKLFLTIPTRQFISKHSALILDSL